MGNAVTWFEVAGSDPRALKDFYGGLFDWKLSDMDAMPYTMVETEGGAFRAASAPTRRAATATSPSTSRSIDLEDRSPRRRSWAARS